MMKMPLPDVPGDDQPVVQPFHREMIERALQKHGLRYLRDSDGDLLVRFGYQESSRTQLDVWMLATGTDDQIFAVMVHSDRRLPPDSWGTALELCNAWNRDNRFMRAYLVVRESEQGGAAEIRLDQHILLQAGIHQALLDELVETALFGAMHFWEQNGTRLP